MLGWQLVPTYVLQFGTEHGILMTLILWLAQAARVAAARQRGARVAVVDPKPTGSGQADLWVRVRPGSDGALAMGGSGI